MARSDTPLERLLGRIDDLDTANLAILARRLARERRLLEAVVNSVREGILVIDHRGLIDYANAAGLNLLGLSAKDVGRVSLFKQMPELARTVDLSREGALEALSGLSRELEVAYPEPRILRLYLLPLASDKEQEQARFVVILSDITRERASTEKRIESARVRSIMQLAAGVAHELGNPLNSLTIHLQLIQRQLAKLPPAERPAAAKIQKSLEVCTSEVARLDAIITHFLDAVRPQEPDFADVDLLAVLEESLELLGPELANAAIEVDLELGPPLPVVAADRGQLKQVYYNLLKNAREAMPQGGTIRIRSRADDEFVYLLIGDTGEGISEENLAKLFQPYFTSKKKGHGLGMLVVQRILQDHGGQVHVDSRPGVGTVITLQFPQKHRRVRLLGEGIPNPD